MSEDVVANLLVSEHGFLDVTNLRIRRRSEYGYPVRDLKRIKVEKWATLEIHGRYFTIIKTLCGRVFMVSLPFSPETNGELMELITRLAPTRSKFVPVRRGTKVLVDGTWIDFPDFIAQKMLEAEAEAQTA